MAQTFVICAVDENGVMAQIRIETDAAWEPFSTSDFNKMPTFKPEHFFEIFLDQPDINTISRYGHGRPFRLVTGVK